MSPIIEVNNLVFEYPGLRALDRVNFSIDAGSVVALVGPNGAGKSTLLRLLAALSTPLDGEVKIAGLNVFETPRAAHKLIGYLSDSFGLWNELPAGESIYFTARMHGLSCNDAKTRARELIDLLDCGEFQQRLNGDLSRGQRQKVGIAQSLVHQPQILLLDEPASGLDPEARSELAAVMRLLKSRGVTLIVSSHILSELQEYSDKMLTIKSGRILSCVDIKQESLSSATTI